jgi:hypothetical protein
MNLSYKKNNNSVLFSSFEKKDFMNALHPQNYIPIYANYFKLTEANYNNINLNNKYSIYDIRSKVNDNTYICQLDTIDGGRIEKPVFFKFSPLLDPVKYMIGKYDMSDNNLLNLPTHDLPNNSHTKVRNPNNAAYVDGFFTYLTSQLLHTHSFIHSLDFYGSFLATKQNFLVNVADDLEYINQSEFFHKNINTLFKLDNEFYSDLLNGDTRNYKRKLSFKKDEEELSGNIIHLSDIRDLTEIDRLFCVDENTKLATDSLKPETDNAELLYEYDVSNIKNSRSTTTSNCSSRTSNTGSNVDDIADEKDLDDNDSETDDSDCSTASEDIVMATINEFPVHIISLEKCDKTLDSLLTSVEIGTCDMSDDVLGATITQILMILITYQKTFGLTHNDLHTNNIMYVKTEKKHLYYKVDDKHYKVPTYGRIFKIIDFGRAIYKYKGTLVCSDSFSVDGDATTQYNCEPYCNKNKPIVEPNFSFDLCRLGCSMFDFYVDDISNIDKITSPIKKIILEWCTDDKVRNVLYKNNGEERYPDFKLYKMIARTVHKHIPVDVLRKPYFEKFIVHKKKINNAGLIMNIDKLPCYM